MTAAKVVRRDPGGWLVAWSARMDPSGGFNDSSVRVRRFDDDLHPIDREDVVVNTWSAVVVSFAADARYDPASELVGCRWRRSGLRGACGRRSVTLVDRLDPDTIGGLVRPVLSRHGVLRAILFGSFARGRQTRRSDVDLMLVVRSERSFFERYDGLLREICRVIPGRDVELLIYAPEELDRIKHRPFVARALSEGKVIHEHRETAA